MDDIFSCKQIKEDGSRSDDFLINAEFVAMLDYYIAASLSAKAGDAEKLRSFYVDRVNLYKGFDGSSAKRPDWRPQLLKVLKDWQAKFPIVARKKKVSLSVLAGADTPGAGGSRLTEDDW